MKTVIKNNFTEYCVEIKTNGIPSISTIKKHLRKAKASDCRSITTIYCDGFGMDLVDMGRGKELMHNGQIA